MAVQTLIYFLLLLTSALYTAFAQQQRRSNITLGSSLTPTGNSSNWPSPSGIYAFGFYQQANGYAIGIFVAGIPERTIVWTANRDDPPFPNNATLRLTAEGRIIVKARGQEINIASGPKPASSASMLDSGNFVLYDSEQEIIWQSFDYPTETLLVGQRLIPGEQLLSSVSETDHSTGIFRLKMQEDGNLVQYPVEGNDTAQYSYWAVNQGGSGNNITLNLDQGGHLYMLNSSSNIISNLTAGGFPRSGMIYLAKLGVNGFFELLRYNLNQRGTWWVVWSSFTDKCTPKGLCGVNAYCITMDEEAECMCPPGFAFVNTGNWTSGCERNYTAESCKRDDGVVSYSMRSLDNTVWENTPYSVLRSITHEDCRTSCLDDCNCEVALYMSGECRKQRLPMRYGRRSADDSSTAFIKIGAPAPVVDDRSPVNPSNKSTKRNKNVRMDILIISISVLSFALLVLVFCGVVMYKNQVRMYKKVSEKGNAELVEDVGPRAFSYAELQAATNGFEEEVGRGSFGTVYKGQIKGTKKPVAVKRLNKVLTEGEGEREFKTEMKVIGKTHHRNLVRLLGYCHDGPERLLVYEYMSNGSLADILFSPESQLISWDERIGIALDIARGILYLHEECETQIIHCDIKPQNILMNDNGCAKISDFGLAKLLEHDQTRTFTGIRGTRGYVAPEWHKKLPVTVKADVYSFGIVLMEIICCRRNVDWSHSDDEAVLEEWVYQCFEAKEVEKLVGCCCEEVVDRRKLERMIKVSIWCIQDEPSLRPSMRKVLLMMEGTVDIPVPPNPTSFLSAI